MDVKFHLVLMNGTMHHVSAIYERSQDTHPPDIGDDVILWGYDGATDDGPVARVSMRQWGTDGTVHAHLQSIIFDPDEMTDRLFTPTSESMHRQYMPWRTRVERSGEAEVVASLEQSGWVASRQGSG